jgi:hypothetical protein
MVEELPRWLRYKYKLLPSHGTQKKVYKCRTLVVDSSMTVIHMPCKKGSIVRLVDVLATLPPATLATVVSRAV